MSATLCRTCLLVDAPGIVEDSGRRVRYLAKNQGYQHEIMSERETSLTMAQLEARERHDGPIEAKSRHVQISTQDSGDRSMIPRRSITEVTVGLHSKNGEMTPAEMDKNHPHNVIGTSKSKFPPAFPGEEVSPSNLSTEATPTAAMTTYVRTTDSRRPR